MNLKATARLLGCLILLAQGWPLAAAVPDDGSNPYDVITERNVFHLNPIPPPPPPPTPKVELPEIKLSGFLRIGKTTHALFSCSPKDKKEEPIYYDLADGQKEGILEVVRIHEEEGEVEIINSGTPLTLSLKNDTLEAKEPEAKKGESGGSRGFRFPGGPEQMPGRAAYRFPVAGQTGGGPPGFSTPMRRARVQQ
jgi:hypothetical protein